MAWFQRYFKMKEPLVQKIPTPLTFTTFWSGLGRNVAHYTNDFKSSVDHKLTNQTMVRIYTSD